MAMILAKVAGFFWTTAQASCCAHRPHAPVQIWNGRCRDFPGSSNRPRSIIAFYDARRQGRRRPALAS